MITISDKNKNGDETLFVMNYLPLYEVYQEGNTKIVPSTIYSMLDNMRKLDTSLDYQIKEFDPEKLDNRDGDEIAPTPFNVESTENNTLIIPITLGIPNQEDRRTRVFMSGGDIADTTTEVRNAWPTLVKGSMGIVTNAYKLPLSINTRLYPIHQSTSDEAIPHLDDLVYFQKNYALALAEIIDHYNELVQESQIPTQPRIVFVIRDASYPIKDHEKLIRVVLGMIYHYIESLSCRSTHIVEAYCIRIHDMELERELEHRRKKEHKEKKKFHKLLKKANVKNKK